MKFEVWQPTLDRRPYGQFGQPRADARWASMFKSCKPFAPTCAEETAPSDDDDGARTVAWDVCFVLPAEGATKKGALCAKCFAPPDDGDDVAAAKLTDVEEGDEEGGGAVGAPMFLRLVERLGGAGLAYKSYYSIQSDEIYVKVRASEARLAAQADARDLPMPLEEAPLEARMAAGFPELSIKPVAIGTTVDGAPVSSLRPYEHVHAKFDDHAALAPLYRRPPRDCRRSAASPFRSMHRVKLVTDAIMTSRRSGGCEIALRRRLLRKEILAYLPLHDPAERRRLYAAWLAYPALGRPGGMPFDAWRDYFGEMHALYMVFLGHTATMAGRLAVAGLAASATIWSLGFDSRGAHAARTAYGAVLLVWMVAFHVAWSRTQARCALRWGMADFEKEEPPRPQYEGAVVRSPVNGREETWFLPRRRRPRLVATGLVTFLMLALVCGFIFLMMIFKHQAGFRRRYGATPAALANALGIQVFHFAYRRIAVKLTTRENWRTETEYADRLTLKLFVFNFVNAYGSLFFTVFIQTHIHIPHEYGESKWDCLDHDCLHDLNYNLYIIFTVSLLAQGFASVVIPLCKRKYHRARETAGESRVAMTKAEWEYLLVEYDETLDTVRNYNTTAVQYGYIALFRAAQESEIPNFKGSDLGHFPLVPADFWTSDHLAGRSRSVDAFSGTRARGTLTLKRG